MRRLTAYILCILCVAQLFSGCSLVLAPNPDASAPSSKDPDPSEQISIQQTQATQPVQTDSSTPTEDRSAPTAPPINDPYPQYVQTNINEIIESSDIYGRNTRPIPISIPKLLPFSEDAIACQQEIQEYFGPMLAEIRFNASKGYGISHAYIEHFVYLNDTILSVVIHERSMFDSSAYTVYNFDTETGEKLETDKLMEKLQVTDYTEKFTQIAQDAFEADWGKTYSGVLEDHRELYDSQKAKNSSKENIDKAMPYIAEDGKVMVVINIYSLAGAEKYPRVFSLS